MEYIKLTFVGDVMCQKELLDAFKIRMAFLLTAHSIEFCRC